MAERTLFIVFSITKPSPITHKSINLRIDEAIGQGKAMLKRRSLKSLTSKYYQQVNWGIKLQRHGHLETCQTLELSNSLSERTFRDAKCLGYEVLCFYHSSSDCPAHCPLFWRPGQTESSSLVFSVVKYLFLAAPKGLPFVSNNQFLNCVLT